jgi:sugar (pentulose or hexulose) kinase
MTFLGVDLGTSFIKGAVLDLSARQLAHVERIPFPEPIATAPSLHYECAPQKIIEAVRALIDKLAPHVPNCAGLVMCSQMHGLVLMNDRGAPISNCITWRDQRVLQPHPSGSGTYYSAILARTNPAIRPELGNELAPARPISFLFWLAQQGDLAPGLTPASLPDFVLASLCATSPRPEATNASAYGAFNLNTLDWHHDLIRMLQLDHLHWPEIRKQGEVAGELKVGSKWVPCYTPVGDAQAALAGALLTSEELSLNIATGAQVSRLTKELMLGDYQTRPYFNGKFLNTLSYPPAGRELNVLLDLLTELARAQGIAIPVPWSYISEASQQAAETDLHIDLNFFPVSGEEGGTISNIRAQNFTVGHMFRAAFNSMAETYYESALRLWPEKDWNHLLLSGGLATKLGELRQAIQNRFAASYRLSPFAEDTLFGLLILASVFSGQAESVGAVSNELRPSAYPVA